MPESTVNPKNVEVRKVENRAGDFDLVIYLRTNRGEKQVATIEGEAQTLYTYDEEQLAVPMPNLGVDVSRASRRLYDQGDLKATLRQVLLDNNSARAALKAALAQAQRVTRTDDREAYEGTPAVDVEDQHNYAEALTIILAPQDVSGLSTEIVGEYKQLVDVGEYRLWRANAPVDTLVSLHEELWAMAPAETLGVLAAVGILGESFLPWAVVNNTTMTQQDAADRRDRIATYLENRGADVAELRAATDEHELVAGLVAALGYTMDQLWAAMA